MPEKGSLIVISGPSGAGKGTLVREITRRVPYLYVSVSATSRPPRSGELDGRDYYFLTEEEFASRVRKGEFLEWAEVHGQKYGTLRSEVEKQMAAGRYVILEIDVQGASQVREAMPREDCLFVFIKPPSFRELERRLRGRGTESETDIKARLRTAKEELREEAWYDRSVVNDNLPRAVDELEKVIVKYHDERHGGN